MLPNAPCVLFFEENWKRKLTPKAKEQKISLSSNESNLNGLADCPSLNVILASITTGQIHNLGELNSLKLQRKKYSEWRKSSIEQQYQTS
jgi:hypothetical protein